MGVYENRGTLSGGFKGILVHLGYKFNKGVPLSGGFKGILVHLGYKFNKGVLLGKCPFAGSIEGCCI